MPQPHSLYDTAVVPLTVPVSQSHATVSVPLYCASHCVYISRLCHCWCASHRVCVPGPYESTSREAFFYFPSVGDFECFGPQVCKKSVVVSRAAPPNVLTVVHQLPPRPHSEQTFDNVLQHGSNEEMCEFVRTQPTTRWYSQMIAPSSINSVASRLWNDRANFSVLLDVLRGKMLFVLEIWSLAPSLGDGVATGELMAALAGNVTKATSATLDQCAPVSTSLFCWDPQASITRGAGYTHAEYYPLFQARAHQLGQQLSPCLLLCLCLPVSLSVSHCLSHTPYHLYLLL